MSDYDYPAMPKQTLPQRAGVEPRGSVVGQADRPAPPTGAVDVLESHSWWGDVEIGEACHFGPVASIKFADGTKSRFQALTVRELNNQIARYGVEVDCPEDLLDQPECICSICSPNGHKASMSRAA